MDRPAGDIGHDQSEVTYLSTSLGLMARDLTRAINRALDERVGRFGLAAHTCRYLALMHDRDGITPKELSDFLNVRSPTTLSALRSLEEKRLIKRTRDISDGRKSIYRLTARGREVEALVRKSALEVEKVAIRKLSSEQVEQFRALVKLIRQSLDESLG